VSGPPFLVGRTISSSRRYTQPAPRTLERSSAAPSRSSAVIRSLHSASGITRTDCCRCRSSLPGRRQAASRCNNPRFARQSRAADSANRLNSIRPTSATSPRLSAPDRLAILGLTWRHDVRDTPVRSASQKSDIAIPGQAGRRRAPRRPFRRARCTTPPARGKRTHVATYSAASWPGARRQPELPEPIQPEQRGRRIRRAAGQPGHRIRLTRRIWQPRHSRCVLALAGRRARRVIGPRGQPISVHVSCTSPEGPSRNTRVS